MQIRKEIVVSGIVQGVGFRPYIYRLAAGRNLGGTISNTASGVTIEVQGPPELVEDFVARLPAEAPDLAQITRVAIREIPCKSGQQFEILPSPSGDPANTLISPDVAVCSDCLRELFDPGDRRYLYPFMNCTNCGPRFTIVRSIPYDRSRTSMSVFPMCDECRTEYDNPGNRRFHAQPNACWRCGPQLELLDAHGHPMDSLDPIQGAAERLRSGRIIAIKGLGGFHLAVDATNSAAVSRLRERKRRVEKPFAVMVPDLETATRFCKIGPEEQRLLISRQRPIMLLPKIIDAVLAESVAPRRSDLGIFLPYTPVHHLLFASGKFEALVMTSGNLSEEPIAIDNLEAAERLRDVADFYLAHDREILLRCDDSVVRYSCGKARQIRRSRGYVPAPVKLCKETRPTLAVGGELKNTLCLTRGDQAFLSQHIGDLENLQSFDFFREAAAHLSKILAIEPEIIAHDMHPEYLSTKWTLAQKGLRRVAVQHHHAHIGACMAENAIEGRVIGFALDGAGYGVDGHIWGGEALLADFYGFERAAHFSYVALPGGAAAIRDPWRMAVSYLSQHFGSGFLELEIPFVRGLNRKHTETILRMIERRVNSPLTSSCGRLFDAVAALAGIRETVTYEAQASMELEAAARKSDDRGVYPFDMFRVDEHWEIGTRSLFAAILEDLAHNVAPETISRRFHNGLVGGLVRLALLLRDQASQDRVCLSGGVFYNSLVLESLVRDLESSEFRVFTHARVPTGDGGLSLGQALIGAHRAW